MDADNTMFVLVLIIYGMEVFIDIPSLFQYTSNSQNPKCGSNPTLILWQPNQFASRLNNHYSQLH